MNSERFTSIDELPIMLNADQVADVLSVSRAQAYILLHRKDFPTLSIGRRLLVPKHKLLTWIDEQIKQGLWA